MTRLYALLAMCMAVSSSLATAQDRSFQAFKHELQSFIFDDCLNEFRKDGVADVSSFGAAEPTINGRLWAFRRDAVGGHVLNAFEESERNDGKFVQMCTLLLRTGEPLSDSVADSFVDAFHAQAASNPDSVRSANVPAVAWEGDLVAAYLQARFPGTGLNGPADTTMVVSGDRERGEIMIVVTSPLRPKSMFEGRE